MRKCILSLSMAFFIVYLSFEFSGCSLIGLGIGAIKDGHEPDNTTATNSQLWFVQPGQNVSMVLRDGTVLKGSYGGIQPVPKDDYGRKYEETCAQNYGSIALPRLGEKVIFAGNDPTDQYECEFAGFDLGLIMIKNIEKNTISGVSTKRYPTFKNSQGNLIDVKALDAMMLEGKIPFVSGAVMKIGSNQKVIPVEQISEVRIPNKKHGKLIGFLIGAGIDAVVIYAISTTNFIGGGWFKWDNVK